METNYQSRLYIAIVIFFLLILAFVAYFVYEVRQSESFQQIATYDIGYKNCVTQCESAGYEQKSLEGCRKECFESHSKT